MSPILRAASYAAVSMCILAAAIEAAPSFANGQDVQIQQIVPAIDFPVTNEEVPLEVPQAEPAIAVAQDQAAEDEQPAEPVEAKSLNALVAAADTESALSAEEECLAGAIYFESRSESLEGQYAVADVILNRADSGRFPRSLCGVVKQRGQFSFVRGGQFPAIKRGSRDWREAVAIARIAKADRWESGAPNALFFHATHVSPRWKLRRVATIGNHVFYR